jgi:hypothetical protein
MSMVIDDRSGELGCTWKRAGIHDFSVSVLFVTLTAPSFGSVHGPRPAAGAPTGGRCRPRDVASLCPHGRSTACMTIHEPKDPLSGAPLCDDCYDWEGAVVWNWWAPELWRRTVIALRRGIAVALGVPDDALNESASLQYAKVAEFQSRGLVHFHALLRLDGPSGAGSPAPIDGYELAQILRRIVPAVDFPAPPVDAADVQRTSCWGAQVDIKIVRAAEVVDYQNDSLKPEQVAGYLAKYATKDVASRGASVGRPSHLRRLERICHHLASRAATVEDESPYALLGRRTQTLGFRGHFSTKSRQYSVTLGALRRARHRFQLLKAELDRTGTPFDQRVLADRLLDEDDASTLIVGSWTFQGSGWISSGDKALALAAAVRAREYAQWRAEQRRNGAHQREVRP